MIDLTSGRLSDFFESHDKRPNPTNKRLKLLFLDVDKVVIKDGGVGDKHALSNKVLLSITKREEINRLSELLEIDESITGCYCMCLGTYAFELFSGEFIKATIGFHHGVSIRYHEWNGDAELARKEELLSFLAELGFTKPLEERLEKLRLAAKSELTLEEWLEIAPKCFEKYIGEILSNGVISDESTNSLIYELNVEIPSQLEQVKVLLKSFGKTNRYWSAYDCYEGLPFQILKKFEMQKIIESYLSTEKDYMITKGLGRFLCHFESATKVRSELNFITYSVIDDIEKCFDDIGEKTGVIRIQKIRNNKQELEGI